MKVYECNNKDCTLAVLGEPGRFTEGVTEEEARGRNFKDFGEDICPNCGHKGKATTDTHKSLEGDDPYQEVHDAVWEEFRPDTRTGIVTMDTLPDEALAMRREHAQGVMLAAVGLLTDDSSNIKRPETAVAHVIKDNFPKGSNGPLGIKT